ncbi:MAG TPA: GGDEF domain-containing protein [Devosia sp.]|nr:GGDEF domain-containing protein [Devosia sp.]
MGAAGFVLAINIFVAGLFAAAFATVAWRGTGAAGARWLALAYILGVVNAVLEYVLPGQSDPRLLGMVVFTVPLAAFLICVIGLSRHYEVTVPWLWLAMLGGGAVLANALLADQPSSASFGRALVYQLPYFFAHVIGAIVVMQARRRGALDVLLIIFLLVSSLQFVAKPFLAMTLGDAQPENYLHSLYGAYSQVLIAFLLVANGVLMLLIIVRDVMAEITLRSETDKLSGLLNRRGFEDRAERALHHAHRAGIPAALVLADLDHFKEVNDSFGHDAGDRVIAAFAALLAGGGDGRMVLGRHGGEEFAIFLPGANLVSARLYAEGVRQAFAALPGSDLGVERALSASFGVTQLQAGDGLNDLVHRADAALYAAKKAGRDRVHTANMEPIEEASPRQSGQAG